jgi:TPR repeat protein
MSQNEPIDNLLNMFDNRFNAEQLVETIRRKGIIIPFVGAGMSANIYRTWKDFLLEATQNTPDSSKKEITQLIEKNKFEEAAKVIKNSTDKKTFVDIVLKEFNPAKIQDALLISNAVCKIPILFPESVVVTTNFDKMLERVYSINNLEFNNVMTYDSKSEHQWGRVSKNREHSLVKLHGDISSPDRLILTTDDYDNVYGSTLDSEYADTVKGIFNNKVIFFMGCSLNNDRTVDLLRALSSDGGHFAMIEAPENFDNGAFEKRKSDLDSLGISCIWYPCGKHENVDLFLSYLISKTRKKEIEMEKEEVISLFNSLKANYGYTAEEMGLSPLPNKISEAFFQIMKMASEGQKKALVNAGLIYEYGFLGESDCKRAISSYKLAADDEDIKGNNNYAWMLYNGICIHTDIDTAKKTAKKLFKKSATIGDPRGLLWTGRIEKEKEEMCRLAGKPICSNSEEYFKQAHKAFKSLAKNNDPVALNNLGVMYRDGEGCIQNKKTATSFFKRAAELNNISAIRELARISNDSESQRSFYKKAADCNDIFSQIGIGNLFLENGNVIEAIKWFKMASKNGYPFADERIYFCERKLKNQSRSKNK